MSAVLGSWHLDRRHLRGSSFAGKLFLERLRNETTRRALSALRVVAKRNLHYVHQLIKPDAVWETHP